MNPSAPADVKRSDSFDPATPAAPDDAPAGVEGSTVFGPVPSRRLGRSLGVDVIPPKTCSYDCIYCESGRTTCLTLQRRVFVPPERVIRDLRRHFADQPGETDVLTLSSAGEPTLYEALGELLPMIKKSFPHLPLAVLTNGSLLWDPEVRKDLSRADIVIPSLDAVSPEVFRKINRPCEGLTIEAVLEGLQAFRKEYRGRLRVEVLLVAHLNDQPTELEKLARVLEAVGPDSVELNTVVRPPAFPGVAGLSRDEMERALVRFSALNARIIGSYEAGGTCREGGGLERRVLDVLSRRPCNAAEMAQSLSVSLPRMEQAIEALLKSGSITAYRHEGILYYGPASRGPQRERDGERPRPLGPRE